jgi:NurA-like 5'-3' nuclease
MVSNFNMDAQHIMKEYVYSKLTEEIHDQGKNCVFIAKERYIKLLNEVGNNE